MTSPADADDRNLTSRSILACLAAARRLVAEGRLRPVVEYPQRVAGVGVVGVACAAGRRSQVGGQGTSRTNGGSAVTAVVATEHEPNRRRDMVGLPARA